MSHHNIVGSEAFDGERPVYIRVYPRRGRGWRGYTIAAGAGGAFAFLMAGVLAYLSHAMG